MGLGEKVGVQQCKDVLADVLELVFDLFLIQCDQGQELIALELFFVLDGLNGAPSVPAGLD